MKHSSLEVIGAYQAVARQLTTPFLRTRSSCVASTLITIECLKRFGVRAVPMQVKLLAMNEVRVQRMDEWYAANPDSPPPLELQQKWIDEDGAWEIGLGHGADPTHPKYDPRGIDGHVVAFTSDHILIDASIDQMDRPEKNIGPMPPVLVTDVTDSRALHEKAYHIVQEGRALLLYGLESKGRAWLRSPDWTEGRRRYIKTINIIEAAMRQAMRPPVFASKLEAP